MRQTRFRVLIAHQSRIPHYRVAFYNAVQRLKPAEWSFAVVFDPDLVRTKRLFGETVKESELDFPIERAPTWSLPFTRSARYQPFVLRARAYDLVVFEDAFNNLAYPLGRLTLPSRVRIAYWGHGRDVHNLQQSPIKKLLERRKLQWSREAAGYFAYTNGVRDFLVANGVERNRVFVLHNTIDIEAHRRQFEALRDTREALRASLGPADARLLLYVGRVNASKRLGLLSAAVRELRRHDQRYRLILAGGGDPGTISALRNELGDGFDYRGVLVEAADLAPLFVACDAFVLPGLLGLAPLTAMCYDLTPIVIESAAHGPEIEYFDAANAVIAPAGTDAAGYADHIRGLLDDQPRWQQMRAAAWPSIRHLTIESMAREFIKGVTSILQS